MNRASLSNTKITSETKSKKTTKPISEIDQKITDLAKSIVNSDSYQGAADAQYLIKQLSKRVIEAMLQGEMTAHLEGERRAIENVASITFDEELKGTWLEMGVGANFNWTENTYTYIDLERTNGGDVKENYRWNIGVRYTF